MGENTYIDIFVNPLQFLEVDEPWASIVKKPVTSEDIYKFLCAPDIPSDMESLTARYKEISQEKKRLFAAPADQRILEKLVWPLRHAKASYIIGNFLSTILLCGSVAEMIALFIFEAASLEGTTVKSKNRESVRLLHFQLRSIQMEVTRKPKNEQPVTPAMFESLRQQERVQLLHANRLIDDEMKTDFDSIRTTRRKYQHLWSQDHDSAQQDALLVFPATVSLIVKAFGLHVTEGKMFFKSSVLLYLRKLGVFVPEDKTA